MAGGDSIEDVLRAFPDLELAFAARALQGGTIRQSAGPYGPYSPYRP